MQRLTIVADDSLVIVDGVGLKVDLTGLDPQIHAVQWNGTLGDIEYRHGADGSRQHNTKFKDVSAYQTFVDRWTTAKAAADAAAAAKAAAKAAATPAAPSAPGTVNVIAH